MEYQEPGRFKAAVLPSFSNDQPAQELTLPFDASKTTLSALLKGTFPSFRSCGA